ncbi:MAG TPA: FtsX-like permease family protein, partial [Bryobacteraceae bacterium]|nr:FtsX-like permease family protein [Bryobacteraceae bacterium]
EALAGSRRKPLLLLLAAVGLLMLVATINAGGILLARAARETREVAIRVSLGAGWRDLASGRLGEAFWLTLGSGTLGFTGACLLLRVAGSVGPLEDVLTSYAQFGELRPDAAVLASSVLLSLCTAVLATLVPFFALRRTTVEHLLRSAGAGASSPRAVWGRTVMATAQIGLSAALLISGALVLRSLYLALNADRGYRTDQVLIAGIGVPEARYDSDEKMTAFHARVIERLRAIPGVTAGAGGAGVPVGTWRTRFLCRGEGLPLEERPKAAIAVVSPGLFPLLETPLVAGRDFRPDDRVGQPLVAIVNRAFATRYLGGRQPLGERIRVAFWNGQMRPWSEFQIVGVVADTRNRSLDAPAEPGIYLSSTQVPLEGFHYVVRTSRDAAGIAREFQQAVWSVDRNLESVTPHPLEEYVEAGLRERRLLLWLLGGFAVLALVIAALGLGGSLATSVTQRRREIGIRLALGETPSRVVARVFRDAARIALLGLAGGVIASLAARRLLASQITGVSPLDPVVLAGVLGVLALAALAAAVAPAWRAAHVDPLRALRED